MMKRELRSKALGMLARRSLTKKELIIRLGRVESNEEAIMDVVEEFESKKYIDEAAIIEDNILFGKQSKLYGRRRIRLELMKRGTLVEEIDKSLDQHFPESDEFEIAAKFVSRKLKSMGGVTGIKQFRRVAGALQRRGFTGDVIIRVLKNSGISRFDE